MAERRKTMITATRIVAAGAVLLALVLVMPHAADAVIITQDGRTIRSDANRAA